MDLRISKFDWGKRLKKPMECSGGRVKVWRNWRARLKQQRKYEMHTGRGWTGEKVNKVSKVCCELDEYEKLLRARYCGSMMGV